MRKPRNTRKSILTDDRLSSALITIKGFIIERMFFIIFALFRLFKKKGVHAEYIDYAALDGTESLFYKLLLFYDL